LFVLLAARAHAQEDEWREVAVRVTAVELRDIDLDAGSDEHVAVGDRVVLQPEGSSGRDAVVRSVTRHTARAEVIGSLDGLRTGIRGVVLVPRARVTPRETPDHPPWSIDLEGWDSEQPLLTDAYVTTRDERPLELHGRAWFAGDLTSSGESGQDDHGSLREGLRLGWENPFGHGGTAELELDGVQRWTDSEGGLVSDDSSVRIERLSYAHGGTRTEPVRWEAGRFLQYGFPELGVLDGFEYTRRLESGDEVGASAGFMPELSIDRTTGDDAQTAVYYRHLRGALELGGALQKTWHAGAPDRDLFLATFALRPSAPLSLRAGVWVDLYGAEDEAKSSGPELTEARMSVNWFEPTHGAALHASRVRWPDLERFEFTPVTLEELTDGVVDRQGVSAWRRLGEDWRVSARLDRWSDENSDGQGYELRAALRERVLSGGEVGVALFSNQGLYADSAGVRLDAWQATSVGTWRVGLDLVENDQAGVVGPFATLERTTLRAAWDQSIGNDWHVSLHGELRSGDEQDSTYVGFLLTRIF
jgi:hypothetical protein